MAELTGVGVTNATVRATYLELSSSSCRATTTSTAFVSAQQVGIARLSLEYCDQMVENDGLRTAFFGARLPRSRSRDHRVRHVRPSAT